jgi:hypothetical protein
METKTRVAPLSEQAKQWQKERETGEVSWRSFVDANAVFSGDYAIVKHEDTPRRGIFEEPNAQGMYSLSTVSGLSEEEYAQNVEGKSVVVLVMCMDARAQRQTYEQVRSQHPDSTILVLSMGGGVVQQDEIKREGKSVEVYRSQALATELSYIQRHTPGVEVVYATGHDCQCGACKFFQDDVAVHEQLGVGKGAEEETAEMASRVNDGVEALVPQEWKDAGLVQEFVVHIDPNTNVFDSMRVI